MAFKMKTPLYKSALKHIGTHPGPGSYLYPGPGPKSGQENPDYHQYSKHGPPKEK